MSLTGNAESNYKLSGQLNGLEKLRGYSAYEMAVKNGFRGTEEEWLESLNGDNSYDFAVRGGYTGTEEDFVSDLANFADLAQSAEESETNASASASVAENAKTAAQSALTGVQNAIKNIPSGSTPIVNDLTTGGTTMALSAEMGKMLGQRPNPNLLHNWYFANPVNQRGQTEYTGAGYTIDRWKTNYSGDTISLEAGGVKNINTSTSAGWHLHQILADKVQSIIGLPITASFLVSDFDGVKMRPIVSFRNSSDSEISALTLGSFTVGLNTLSGIVPSGTEKIRVGLYATSGVLSGNYTTLLAAKLELGSSQTLAHQDASGNWVLNEIPDYGEELAKCQRYQMVYSPVQYAQLWPAVPVSSNNARVTIQTPAELRNLPTPTFDFSILELFDGVTSYPITTTPTVFTRAGNCIVLNIATNSLNVDKTYMVRATASTKIVLDANL